MSGGFSTLQDRSCFCLSRKDAGSKGGLPHCSQVRGGDRWAVNFLVILCSLSLPPLLLCRPSAIVVQFMKGHRNRLSLLLVSSMAWLFILKVENNAFYKIRKYFYKIKQILVFHVQHCINLQEMSHVICNFLNISLHL